MAAPQRPEPGHSQNPIADAVARDLGEPGPLGDWVMDPFAPVPPPQGGESKPARQRRKRKTES